MTEKNTKGKWDKPDDDRKKQQMRIKYLQNQEKRKQLAIDNQKRRKQLEKRRQQETEVKKREEQESLKVRKQSQQDAYLKYLRRNSVQKGMNLYDRHEAQKKSKKQQVTQVRSVRKWGEPVSHSKQKKDQNILALDLDVHVTKDMEKIKKFYQQGKQQLKILQEFQKEWQQSQDMIASSLLDSLDLDKNSIANSNAMSKGHKKQPIFQSYQKMKQSFLSQSLQDIPQKLQQIQPIKKQEQPKQQFIKQYIKQQPKQPIKLNSTQNKFKQQLQQLIGYDSLNQSSAMWNIDAFKKKQTIPQNQIIKKENRVSEPIEIEQIQQKKVQLFNWAPAIQQVQESAVSSNVNKKHRRDHILKNVNQRIREQKRAEQQFKVPNKQERRKSLQHKKQIQRRYNQLSQQRARKINKSNDRSTQKPKRLSEQKLPPINPNFQGSRYSNITAPVIKSSVSKDSSRLTAPIPKQTKTSQKFKESNNKNTTYFDNPVTTCTQDDNLEMQQFIKQDLLDLNMREKELQKQIKNLHFGNKGKIKQIQQKYKIQTNYRNTKQYLNKQIKNNNQNKIQCITQDQLQDSLMRLDDLLKKQDRKLTYLNNLPIQQRRQSQDSLRISDSLQSDTYSKHQSNNNKIDHPDSKLLSEIIKLAARNIGQDETNVDLNKLRSQLSKINQNQHLNKNNQSKNIPATKQIKQEIKRDSNQLTYLQIMKIKSAANNQTKSKEKIQTKPIKSIQNIVVNSKSIQESQDVQKQVKDDKISVNQRLRRLLLQ